MNLLTLSDRRQLAVVALMVVMALGAGCSSSSKGGSSSASNAQPADSPAWTAGPNGTMVPVSITDQHIIMPATLPAGQCIFQITNNTKKPRDLRITGDGVYTSLLDPLQPGESGEMLVQLHPGPFTATCLDGKHGSTGISFQFKATP